MRGPVVVGVDSSSSLAAVEAAAREAERLGTGLRLAHALTWSSAHLPPGVPPWDRDGAAARVRLTGPLNEAERAARRIAPGVAVTQDVLIGEPPAVLESQSRTASLTVVGSGPADGVGGRLRPSVAGQLAARSRGPLLVIRGRPGPDGPVVLGDDLSREAAEFAFSEAIRRGTDLVVLHPRTRAARPLSALRKKHPDIVVRERRADSWTGHALVEASGTAQLVVIGARQHRIADTLRVSAARILVDHAHCPVAVIPLRKA
ncbi:universal stress protein [Streptomyces sp. SLBN-8D4]|jgi:nucleotide-binding universal stress UspA family protein|uniref:universal stress protein n=1 Tax=Streptomyces sp. SLBN-8D4 TaxID=3377728 RepID=UPI003C7C001E